MRNRAASVWLLLVFITGLLPTPSLAARGTQGAPKLINFYLDWQIPDAAPAELAKWDIVVLDMDQQFMNPDKVREIKRLNPNVKILAYVAAGEIAQARGTGHPASPGFRLHQAIPESWYLHRADGSRASWWPGSQLLNATNLGPTSNGQRWNTFLGPWIRDELMSSGLWDGVFLDAAYSSVTGFFGTNLDPDGNGLANPAKQNDESYAAGMRLLIQNVRAALGSNKLILNNSSTAYADVVNGTLFENFPRYGWAWPFTELRNALSKNKPPKISAINTNTNNQETPGNYQLMRYGLASALVADAYFSFDAGDRGHHRTWWYDEYDAPVGNPRAAARVVRGPSQGAYPAVWARDYARGVVLVNSTTRAEEIQLSGEYERLRGSQDPATNNGEILNRVRVPSEGGVILLRRSEATEVRGAAFTNGDFLQVYNREGTRIRNGFFASRDDVPGGAVLLQVDLDRDGTEDLAYAHRGEVVIRLGRGGETRFRPYGRTYTGGIELTAGQTNRDTPWELVLAPADRQPANIIVANLRGQTVRSWLAYRREFTGGATVAIGDLNGDGLREIATGPGRGGGPHIRTFKTDGQPWGGAFFAFDANERGGARVAIGDVDGDGRAELVIGSGPGSAPRVRVYDGGNGLVSEFSLGSQPSAAGVKPVVSDIDGDGKAEILIPGTPF